MAEFQIVSGQEDKLFLDMGLVLTWESAPDRKTTTFTFTPVENPEQRRCAPREIVVHLTGDVEIKPAIETLDGSHELRQWASLLIWCSRTAYEKVYHIFSVPQTRFQ